MDELLGEWRVESVGGRAAEGEPRLEFAGDGTFAGTSGLNRIRGAYTAADGVLRCATPVTTKMAGPPELLDQEARLLAALAVPAPVAPDGDRLVLGAADGAVVLVRPRPDPWGGADYRGLAVRLAPAAEALVAATAPGPGSTVLDVAAGTGNAAVAAARRGARVTACDLSPAMVAAGRADTAGLGIDWHIGDIEALPVDGPFDVVLSSFGLIFAMRPEVALAEAHRVLRPGGRLAFTAWTAEGYMGRMAGVVRRWLPPRPGAPDTLDWGRPDVLAGWLAAAGFEAPRIERTALPWHFDSGPAMTAFMRAHSPAHAAAAAQLGDRADEMFAAVEQLAAPDGGAVRQDGEYLVVVADRG